MSAIEIDLQPIVKLTDDQYFDLCQVNRDLKIERTAQGKLIIMPPTGGETGNRNMKIAFQLESWNQRTNLGLTFDSSTEFKLPNGANYSPDASWVQREKWNALTPEQRRKFPPLAPDFVVELRSETDSMMQLRKKMQEYIDSGVRLGWLIDPKNRQVEVYRANQPPQILQNPESLSGEDVLFEFVLDLKPIFANI
ncbi:Uma2 family endonuclease [Microcoleus sp. FACHB-1515]|uniref:Uma2 family endonuclease n=1 Tax=Cyanophyceae TaxID=3028117 RepID=UPI001684117C|nr:Uma2 family endonuclease [Microcoleus sp. FACHB-1515]MBD2090862.1 Uma2 family endonuclease [Microcoleus sp. FACHB-1515]